MNNKFGFSLDSSWYISLLPSSVAPSKGPFICNAVFRGQLVLCLECWDKDGAFWEHCHDQCLHKKGKDGTCHFEWQENVHYAELSSTKQKDPKRVKTCATSPAEQPLLPASRAEHNNLQALAPSMRNDRGVSWIAGARRQGDVYIQHGACDIDLPSQDMFSHKIYPGSKYQSVNRKIWKHFQKAQGCLYAGSESQRHITTVTIIQRLGPYPAKSILRTLKLLPT